MSEPGLPQPSPRLSILEILDLRSDGADRYFAPTPAEGPPRLFGGQVASQALRAATLTVPPYRRPHSLHSYFIRPGRPGITLQLTVERTRDGRSFSTRRVDAAQDGESIFILDASFHVKETGDDWQSDGVLDAPPADELPALPAQTFPFRPMMPFEIRPIRRTEGFRLHPCWVRLREPIEADEVLHACALTYVSDVAVVGSTRAPGSTLELGDASLDHAVWFHRPVHVDEWLLFSVDPVVNFGARGFARGKFQTADGTLVASVSQECLLRPAMPTGNA